MGSAGFYAEERPVRVVDVAPFWIDLHPVTNDAFARFVTTRGHVTDAERAGRSLVFVPTAGPVDLRTPARWWEDRPGACWRAPEGPGSSIDGRADHPVVHVSFADAAAYAAWRGGRLPSEGEWECAARGGLDGADYAWGDALSPGGRVMANTWHGEFPWRNLRQDGHERTSPVGSFPPNAYGLYDMIGNVWEWTRDDYAVGGEAARSCCAADHDPAERLKVIKGGSYLCAPNYCQRYRPASRAAQAMHGSTGHIGFRCVMDRTP